MANFKSGILDISPDISPQPLHAPTADYISIPRSDEPVDPSANFNAELDVFQGFLTSASQNMERSSNNTLQQSMYLQDTNNLATEKTSAAALLDWKMSDWSPEMQAGAPFPEDSFATLQHSTFPHAMYQGSVEGFPLSNLSCQTFATTSSSDSEQPRLMTPPPRTSPLPFIPQDQLSRRESDTANLATGLNTIHLQQSQSNMDLGSETFDHHTASASHTPEGTPPTRTELLHNTNYNSADLQQQAGRSEQQVPRLDLAARRKRPRPAALRPEAGHRSQSYAGPLTQSPTARMPSLSVAKLNSVRRIKSTGNGLNVANGRVQKPSLSPSPLSPHNFQCLSSDDFLMQNAQVTQGPLTPLSPPTVEQPAHSWPEQWSIAPDHPTPTEFSAEARVTSPPVTPYNNTFPHPFADGASQASQSWPPSSAPPQQTTFFDSPPLPSNHFGHLSWQVPSSMSIQNYPEEVSNPAAHPASVPQYGYVDLQHLAGQQYAYQQAGYCHQPPFVESSPPQKEIEIQVQVIPAPEGLPQGKKTYTFNHTTPKDFSSQDGGVPFKVAGTTDPNPV